MKRYWGKYPPLHPDELEVKWKKWKEQIKEEKEEEEKEEEEKEEHPSEEEEVGHKEAEAQLLSAVQNAHNTHPAPKVACFGVKIKLPQ